MEQYNTSSLISCAANPLSSLKKMAKAAILSMNSAFKKEFALTKGCKIQLNLMDTVLMPDSVLRQRSGDISLEENPSEVFIGEKPRFSTCSDVTWLDENIIVTSNLNGQSLHSFEFNELTCSLEHKQTIRLNFRAGGIDYLANERVIAVTNSTKKKNVALFRVDENGVIHNDSFKESKQVGEKFIHSVQFTPGGKFLFATQNARNPSIVTLNRESLEIISNFKNYPQRPKCLAKSLCFTADKRWMFCSWANKAKPELNDVESYISIHAYDSGRGTFSKALYASPVMKCHLEGISFLGDDVILAVDQYGSRILQFFFDAKTIALSSPLEIYKTNNGWSSLHGGETSPSNKYLAVTDHVLDAVHVFKIG